MKFLKVFSGLILLLVIVLVVVSFLLPSERHVERSLVIDAAPAEIFPLLNDFREFNKWSPWATIDPEGTAYEFSGPPAGIGSMMAWSSENSQVGSGTQKILESVRNESVKSELRFDGFEAPAYAEFTLAPTAGGTEVTWSFDAEMDGIVGRYMGVMIDKWVGADYDRGLLRLQELAE